MPHIEHIRGTTWLNRLLRNRIIKNRLDEHQCLWTKLGPIKFQEIDDYRHILEEEEFFKHFLSALQEDSIVYDVGGYHGFYAVIGSLGKICYCFEPDISNLTKLQDNVKLNAHLDQNRELQIIEKAAWNSDETIQFNSGQSGKSSIIADEKQNGIVVNSICLDTFIQTHEAPDILKIDVEGAEGKVLEGAKNLLKEYKPILFLEIHDDRQLSQFNSSAEEIERYLKQYNYHKIVEIPRGYEKQIICQ